MPKFSFKNVKTETCKEGNKIAFHGGSLCVSLDRHLLGKKEISIISICFFCQITSKIQILFTPSFWFSSASAFAPI